MILIPKPNEEIKYKDAKFDTSVLKQTFSGSLETDELFALNNIKLIVDSSFEDGEYMITIESGLISIVYSTSNGLINAKNTLNSILMNNPEIYINEFSFRDKPKYKHREFMLDTARNYFGVTEIKKY